MKIKKEITWYYFNIEHLRQARMSYGHHCSHALKYGFQLIWLGLASIIHAFIPGILKFYSAKGVVEIYTQIRDMNHLKRIIDDKIFTQPRENTNLKDSA